MTNIRTPASTSAFRRRTPRAALAWLALLPGLLGASGCSIRGVALDSLADTFASAGNGYSSDDDPELVASAVPFALKTMEQIAAERPKHRGLLLAMCSGFTQYGFAFVASEADLVEDRDMARAVALRTRARKLFLRARDYGLRALDVAHPGLRAAFTAVGPEAQPRRAALLALARKDDVPLLYWTAAAWTLAVANGKDQMGLVGELPLSEQLMARALELDESWSQGAIHEFYVSYDASRSEADGGGPARAKTHLDRALALGSNRKVSPLVSFAESVSVAAQNRAEFRQYIERALAVDITQDADNRLANTLAQRRARWLLAREADLFVE